LSGAFAASSLQAMTTLTSEAPLRELEQRIGFIPNLAAAIADSPVAIASFVAQQGALRHTNLTPLEREVVGITVSAENECEYSLAAHSAFARGAGGSDELVAALRAGEPVSDSRLRELQELTRSLLREGGHVPAHDDALEVITQIAYTTMANYAANVADTPIDEAFKPPV
jgi:AhpD family alkylhydroperoxidase